MLASFINDGFSYSENVYKVSTKMSKIFFLSMCDVKVFLTFDADLITVLPVLFKYCCK